MMAALSLRTKLRSIPWPLFCLVWIICFLGVLSLYSAGGMSWYPWASKQISFIAIFSVVAIVIACIDIKYLYQYSYLIYFTSLFLLLLVELVGYTAMGATRWIQLGFIRLQPSEIMKVSLVLFFARYIADRPANDWNKIYNIIPLIFAAIVPVALIIKQPDLGTGMLTILAAITIFFAIGVSVYKFIIAGGTVALMLPIIWSYLREYQKKRVMIFLNPEMDKLGAGYNIIQSKIAIGSGGISGKGLGEGSQSNLSFLPEHQTDFIFASYAEEFGFFGASSLICLYLVVIWYTLSIAQNTRSNFGRIVALGICSIFFWHIFINIAMVIGLVPVVGVPLPLISYGGTMIGSILIGFGLIANCAVHYNFMRR